MKVLVVHLLGACVLASQTVCGQTSATIQPIAIVPTKTPTNIVILLASSDHAVGVHVALRCLNGRGKAGFSPDYNVLTNIHESTNLMIQGITESSVPSNMIVEIRHDTNILSARTFTVVDTTKIGFSKATVLAKAVIAGIAQTERGAPITVELDENGNEYVITFWNKHEEGVLKGDFAAQVRIDAIKGSTVSVLGGP